METIDDLIKDREIAEKEITAIMTELCDKYPDGKFKLYYFVGEKTGELSFYESQVKIMVEL